MNSATTTTCCGVVFAVGLLLPVARPIVVGAGQAGPVPPGFDLIWRQRLEGSGAVQLTLGARTVIASGAQTPTALRALEDGRELWRGDHQPGITPTLTTESVLLASNNALMSVAPATGASQWTTSFEGLVTHVTAEGDLVVAADSSTLRGLGAADGRERWAAPLSSPLTSLASAEDGAVLFGTQDGWLRAADPKTGAMRWAVDLGPPIARIVPRGARAYARGPARGFFVANVGSGWIEWSLPRAEVIGDPAEDSDRIYLAVLDNSITAVDRRSGTRRWKRDLDGRPLTGPWLAREVVVVPLTSGEIVTLRRTDGTVLTPPAASAQSAVETLIAFRGTADGEVFLGVTVDFGGAQWLSAIRRGK